MAKRKWTKEEIEDYRISHGSFFYYNKDDSNFLVPKAFGFGLTINWANPLSWLLIAALVLLIVFRRLA